MKSSRYNIYHMQDDKFYIYHQLSSALIQVDKNLFESLRQSDIAQIETDTIEQLRKMALICDTSVEESDLIVAMNKKARYANQAVRMTIMPTMNCNFNCWYCYESHEKKVMTQENIATTIAFAKNIIEQQRPRQFIIDWFGGESLMCFKKHVYTISKEIKKACEQNGISFKNIITTNGYYITPDMITLFNEIELNTFQITLDGAKEFHNKTRFMEKDRNSYDRICRNIELLCAGIKRPSLTLRLNYTKENISTIDDIIETFPKEIRPLITISMQVVWQQKHEMEKEIKLICQKEKLFKAAGYIIKDSFCAHTHSALSCYAENMQQYVINYDMNVYKCTARDFNDKRFSIGHITADGVFIPTPLYYKYYATPSAFENEICLKCELLPSCKSACIQKRIEGMQVACRKEFIESNVKNKVHTLVNRLK